MFSIDILKQISSYGWEIPQETRGDMRVPVRLFATRELLEAAFDDKSIEQAINAATLPGLVGRGGAALVGALLTSPRPRPTFSLVPPARRRILPRLNADQSRSPARPAPPSRTPSCPLPRPNPPPPAA